jgi:hypothetical protein
MATAATCQTCGTQVNFSSKLILTSELLVEGVLKKYPGNNIMTITPKSFCHHHTQYSHSHSRIIDQPNLMDMPGSIS